MTTKSEQFVVAAVEALKTDDQRSQDTEIPFLCPICGCRATAGYSENGIPWAKCPGCDSKY